MFLSLLNIFTVTIIVFVAIGLNKLNAECSIPEGSYKERCSEIKVKKNGNNCRVDAKCLMDQGKQPFDTIKCRPNFDHNRDIPNWFCRPHWKWDANKPTPKLKNQNG